MKKDDLTLLLNRLSPSEKRFFRLFADLYERPKKYNTLFDKLLESLDNPNSNKNTIGAPSMRHYLLNLLLKSLVVQYNGKSYYSSFQVLSDQFVVLYDKGMMSKLISQLAKAKKRAIRAESMLFYLDVIRWEKRLVSDGVLQRNIDDLVIEEQEAIDKITQLNKQQNAAIKVSQKIKKLGKSRAKEDYLEIEKLIDELKSKLKNGSANTARGLYYLNYIHGSYAYACGKIEEGVEFLRKALEVIDLYKEDSLIDTIEYLRVRHNYIFLLAISGFELDSKKEMKHLMQFQSSYDSAAILQTESVIVLSLSDFSSRTAYAEFELFVKEYFDLKWKAYGSYMSSFSRINIFYSIGNLYFGLGKFEESVSWFDKLLSEPNTKQRKDMYNFSKVISLICHFELGHSIYVHQVMSSLYKHLYRTKRLYKGESIIIKFIKEFQNASIKELKQEIAKSALLNIQRLRADPYEKNIFHYFHFDSWLETKSQKISFEDAVKKKNANI